MSRNAPLKLDKQPERVQRHVMTLASRSMPYTQICQLLLEEYGLHISVPSVSKFVKRKREGIGNALHDDPRVKEEIADSFANMIKEFKSVHDNLMQEFRNMNTETPLREKIQLARLIKENVELCLKNFGEPTKKVVAKNEVDNVMDSIRNENSLDLTTINFAEQPK